MTEDEKREILLVNLMHIVADTFKDMAILKGGMYLRLLKSPRQTRDIDYVFQTTESRKVILAQLEKVLEKNNIEIQGTPILNSRGIFLTLKRDGVLAKLEISIQKKLNCPTTRLTTTPISGIYDMSGQVVTCMALSESYANKIAATLERVVMRDLYDITIYQPLTSFDQTTLQNRLKVLQVNRGKKESIDFKEATIRLKKRIENLTQAGLERELLGLVEDDFFHGGVTIIKKCINRLCDELSPLE